MVEKETINNLAKELKIDLFTTYREYLQLLFLKYFYSRKNTDRVFFKGGTALRFLFGSFRFSEDLDFTSLVNKEVLKNIIFNTLKDLEKEAEDITFKEEKTIANSFSGRIFQKLKEFKFPLSIRLDFSQREKIFLIDNSVIETPFPLGPYPQITHLKIEELMAEKIRAILSRVRGRDVFDLWFMLSKKVTIDWSLVSKKMALYKKEADVSKLIVAIQKVPQKEIKEDLTRFLPVTHRSLVEKLKSITLEKLKT